MAGIREVIKTVEGIKELAYILSIPISAVQKMANEFNAEGEKNLSENAIENGEQS